MREIAWKAQTRLCQRYRQMLGKGKLKQGVVTAIARELAGFVWAIACITSDPPQPDLGENGCASRGLPSSSTVRSRAPRRQPLKCNALRPGKPNGQTDPAASVERT